MRVVATKTATAAWRAVKDIETITKPIIAMRQREVVRYRVPTDTEVARARQILALPAKERWSFNRPVPTPHTMRSPNRARTEKVIIQAIRIGDEAIVSMPFEVLVD